MSIGCKRCGDPEIDKKYRCHSCDVVVGRFKWCVITGVTEGLGDDDGGWFDETIDFKEIKDVLDIRNGKASNPFKGKDGFIHIRRQVFQQGEIFPISDAFGREMTSHGRKPGKWDINYELFSSRDYKKAIQLAIKVTKASYKEQNNLDMVEQKYVEKLQLTEKLQQLRESTDKFKVIYGWIKQNHITLKEARSLLGEVFNNENI